MTGPRINPSDLAPFYPAGTRPTTEAGKQILRVMELDDVGPAQHAKDEVRKLLGSGYRDTLEMVAGPHNVSLSTQAPLGYGQAWRSGTYAGMNLGQGTDKKGNIILNPVSFGKMYDVLPPDHPGNQMSQILAHEYGHTVATLPGLFPDSVDVLGRASTDAHHFGMSRPMSLFEQWRQIVGKNMNLTEENKTGLQHEGWFTNGQFNRGEPEMFADAFERAMTTLRDSWDASSPNYKTARAAMLENEKENPGTMYLVKWLTTQPAFKNHPLGKMIRSKEGLAGPANAPRETLEEAMARGQRQAQEIIQQGKARSSP